MRVDEMGAGRELDALVAEKVMGLEVFTSKRDYFDKGMPHAAEFDVNVGYPAYYHVPFRLATCVPLYSTDIAAAWKVVEKVTESHLPNLYHDGQLWVCEWFDCLVDVVASAPTAPLAICRAALKAVGIEEIRSE